MISTILWTIFHKLLPISILVQHSTNPMKNYGLALDKLPDSLQTLRTTRFPTEEPRHGCGRYWISAYGEMAYRMGYEDDADECAVQIELEAAFCPYYSSIDLSKLPASLQRLALPSHFNSPIDNLPSTLSHLITGEHFNQPVYRLPSSVTHLSVGYSFQQPVSSFPPTLTHYTWTKVTTDKFKRLGEICMRNIYGQLVQQ